MTGSPMPVQRRIYNLGPASRIPLGEGKVYEVAGRALAVFRTRQGMLHATQAACPHRGGPLADGVLGSGLVVCPLHGFKFELSTGSPVGNDCRALETYRVELTGGGDMLLFVDEP